MNGTNVQGVIITIIIIIIIINVPRVFKNNVMTILNVFKSIINIHQFTNHVQNMFESSKRDKNIPYYQRGFLDGFFFRTILDH